MVNLVIEVLIFRQITDEVTQKFFVTGIQKSHWDIFYEEMIFHKQIYIDFNACTIYSFSMGAGR